VEVGGGGARADGADRGEFPLLLLWHREETDRRTGEETERVESVESVDRTGARQQVVASQSVSLGRGQAAGY